MQSIDEGRQPGERRADSELEPPMWIARVLARLRRRRTMAVPPPVIVPDSERPMSDRDLASAMRELSGDAGAGGQRRRDSKDSDRR